MMDKLISQQAAIDKIKKRLYETAFNNVGIKQNIDETLVDVAENRLENWFGELPSIQPDTTTHDSISAKTGGNDEDRTSGDCISRQAESNPLEKCYTCKHVYQRVSDADTLYCRCRKGCRYEEFEPKRSNNDSGRHED